MLGLGIRIVWETGRIMGLSRCEYSAAFRESTVCMSACEESFGLTSLWLHASDTPIITDRLSDAKVVLYSAVLHSTISKSTSRVRYHW